MFRTSIQVQHSIWSKIAVHILVPAKTTRLMHTMWPSPTSEDFNPCCTSALSFDENTSFASGHKIRNTKFNVCQHQPTVTGNNTTPTSSSSSSLALHLSLPPEKPTSPIISLCNRRHEQVTVLNLRKMQAVLNSTFNNSLYHTPKPRAPQEQLQAPRHGYVVHWCAKPSQKNATCIGEPNHQEHLAIHLPMHAIHVLQPVVFASRNRSLRTRARFCR